MWQLSKLASYWYSQRTLTGTLIVIDHIFWHYLGDLVAFTSLNVVMVTWIGLIISYPTFPLPHPHLHVFIMEIFRPFFYFYGLEVALKLHFQQSFAPSNEVFTPLSYPREIIIVSMKKLQGSMTGSKIHSLRWEARPGLIWWEKFFIFYHKLSAPPLKVSACASQ